MFIYSQSSGQLWDDAGEVMGIGYSGHGEGKNNPLLQGVRNVGPIPRGYWVIAGVYDSARVGPLTLRLEPHLHDALGRTYFRIHGDSIKNPGEASKGCIIQGRVIRQAMVDSKDKLLLVIE